MKDFSEDSLEFLVLQRVVGFAEACEVRLDFSSYLTSVGGVESHGVFDLFQLYLLHHNIGRGKRNLLLNIFKFHIKGLRRLPRDRHDVSPEATEETNLYKTLQYVEAGNYSWKSQPEFKQLCLRFKQDLQDGRMNSESQQKLESVFSHFGLLQVDVLERGG